MKFLTANEIREQLDKMNGPDKIELVRSCLELGSIMNRLSHDDQVLVASMWAEGRLDCKVRNEDTALVDPELQKLLSHLSEEDRYLTISMWNDGILDREQLFVLLRLKG